MASFNNPGTENDPNPEYDPVVWASISSKLEYASWFERYHPMVETFRIAVGMPVHELDDLWKYAAVGS